MIAHLKGKIAYARGSYVVVDVNNVGYKVHLSAYTFGKVAGKTGRETDIYVHTHVREDTLALYGFLVEEELEMFELLLSISGIGPKAALGILSIATPRTIQTAILNEDPSILTKVSGIGKKTADRVILELKNKVADMPDSQKEKVTSDADALEALVSMGYTISEARDALKSVSADIKDVGARIREALRNMGKR